MKRILKITLVSVCVLGIVFSLSKSFVIHPPDESALINYEYDIGNDAIYVIKPIQKPLKKVEITPYRISQDKEVTIEVTEGEIFTLSLLSNSVYQKNFTWNIKKIDIVKEAEIKNIGNEIIQPKIKNSFGFTVQGKWTTT
jgi:hypothetical protein